MTPAIDPADLDPHLHRMRQERRRLARIEIDGRKVWIRLALAKQLVVQLTKGSPRRLLAREARMLAAMAARGAPVPAVLATGDDHLVLEDAGRVLTDPLDRAPSPTEAAPVLAATGAALAQLHATGCTHGRPYIRDILVGPDGAIRFVDLERGARLDAPARFRARDLALLLLSLQARYPASRAGPMADTVLRAYLAAAPRGMSRVINGWARGWRWLVPATALLRWNERRFHPNKVWKEYAALPPVIDRLSALDPG